MTTDTSLTTPEAPASTERRLRRCTANYRWTQSKVLAFLDALSKCGRVTDAARAVGMSRTSAYRLRVRMASARFDAAFEGARRTGIRARGAASRARAESAARLRCDGPEIAAMIARERASSQADTGGSHGDMPAPQGHALSAQGGALARKVTL